MAVAVITSCSNDTPDKISINVPEEFRGVWLLDESSPTTSIIDRIEIEQHEIYIGGIPYVNLVNSYGANVKEFVERTGENYYSIYARVEINGQTINISEQFEIQDDGKLKLTEPNSYGGTDTYIYYPANQN